MTEVDREVGDDTRRHLTQVARGGALGLIGAAVTAITGFVLVLIVTNLYDTNAAGRFFTVTSAFMRSSSMPLKSASSIAGRISIAIV